MGNHMYDWIESPPPFRYQARCNCGWTSDRQATKQAVDDQIMKHEAQVQRVRAQLGTRRPSLKSQRDYYQQMADDHTNPSGERELWQGLADELSDRLGDDVPAGQGQEALPFDVKGLKRSRSDIT